MSHKQLSFKEHLKHRAFYGGSAVSNSHEFWVYESQNKVFVKKNICYGDALLDNFDEMLVNVIDHFYRSIENSFSHGGRVSYIKISLNEADGMIQILNDGPGIPVIETWEGKNSDAPYLPQAIITEERTGSNFDDKVDPDRITGGLNGLGIKIVVAGSLEFHMETVDSIRKLKYEQSCYDRMDRINPPKVTNAPKTKPYTCFRWKPDYDNLCKISKDEPSKGWYQANKDIVKSLITLRSYQCSVFINTVKYRYDQGKKIEHKPVAKVFLNNQDISISFGEFLTMFGLKDYVLIPMEVDGEFPWYVAIGLVSQIKREITKHNIEQMTIVNGIYANLGGSHVNLMIKNILSSLSQIAKQEITEWVFQKVFCYFDLKQFPFRMFDFESQTKNSIKIGRKDINHLTKTFEIPDKYIKSVWNIAKDEIVWLLEKRSFDDQVKQVKKARVGHIRKYDKAERAGSYESAKCCLAIPEGDSACKIIRDIIKGKDAPVDKKYYGTYNIQGVPPNARKMIKIIENPQTHELIIRASRQLQENIAFNGLVAAVGLNYTYHYDQTPEGDKQFAELNYGSILITTDQDLDGIGQICSLIIVFIMCFWPNLIKRGFVKRFATPIIRVYTTGSNVYEFYSKKEYISWATSKWGSEKNMPSAYQVEYYKGLSSHTAEEVQDMATKFLKCIFIITWDDAARNTMEVFFGEDTDGRKVVLSSPVIDEYPDNVWKTQKITATTHFKVETKEFQLSNMRRKLKSCIDGMIPTQRKAFAGARRMFAANKNSKFRVYQVSGYITKEMKYEHGDASMNGVITKMAQGWSGTNNLPAFVAVSNGFGDRVEGRGETGGARYIDTRYNHKLMDVIFPRQDDWLLEYVNEENTRCEPIFYIPIVPMALLETETTTGTGWKIDIFARSWSSVLTNVRRMINNYPAISLAGKPWFPSDKMSYRSVNGKEACYGSYKYDKSTNIITITELPLRVWSYSYICWLQGIDPKTGKTEKIDEDGNSVPLTKRPYIVDVKDDTSNYVNDIRIWLEPGAYEKILVEYGTPTSDPIEHFLELRKFMVPNLNLIDETGYVHEFDSYNDMLNYWFPFRRNLYQIRIERQTHLLDYEIQFWKNVLRFILMDAASPKEINIDKDFEDDERDRILREHNFTQFNKQALFNPKFLKIDELHEAIMVKNASYDYISDIQIRDKSKKQVIKLKEKIKALELELAHIIMSDWKTLWLEDLEQLEPIVEEGIKTNWLYGTKKHKYISDTSH